MAHRYGAPCQKNPVRGDYGALDGVPAECGSFSTCAPHVPQPPPCHRKPLWHTDYMRPDGQQSILYSRLAKSKRHQTEDVDAPEAQFLRHRRRDRARGPQNPSRPPSGREIRPAERDRGDTKQPRTSPVVLSPHFRQQDLPPPCPLLHKILEKPMVYFRQRRGNLNAPRLQSGESH